MTPRDRMQMVVTHQRPDRTPGVLAGRPEVHRALVEYYGVDSMADVHEILGTGGRSGVGLGVSFPDFEGRANGKLEGDFPYAGRRVILHGDDLFEDEWGVVRKVGDDRK